MQPDEFDELTLFRDDEQMAQELPIRNACKTWLEGVGGDLRTARLVRSLGGERQTVSHRQSAKGGVDHFMSKTQQYC